MERRYQADLDRWHVKKNRKPLVIRGSRQVGKSTLVRQFADAAGLMLFEVNLERQPQLAGAVKTLDPRKILREIEFICGKGAIRAGEALLFIDEIQGMPQMLQCLRYFYEELPELAVIAAGSLLEFALADHSFPMPVGRIEYFSMGPVTWEEFLKAKGELQLLELLETFQLCDDFPLSAHERLLDLMRDYLLVGGMPEAVQLHLDGEDWEQIFQTQEGILQTYRDDFSKYATGRSLVTLQRVVDYLGQGVGRKVKFVNIDASVQAREVKAVLDLILKAGVVLKAEHSHGNGIPLNAEINAKVFKLFCLDVGLYQRITRVKHLSDEEIRSVKFINGGALAEQFMAQQIHSLETPGRLPALHYWLREGGRGNAEIDFLLQVGTQVVPLEIKAGKSGTLKSLFQFMKEKKGTLACRFDLNPPSLQEASHVVEGEEVSFKLVSLPLYCVLQAERILR